MPLRPKTVTTKAYQPKTKPPKPVKFGVGNDQGGQFTPSGFVPNKPTVAAPPNQAPYLPGKSPTQQTVKGLAASGAVRVQPSVSTAATQRMLNAHGAHLKVDGRWGPATESAYRAYLFSAQTKREATKHIDASTSPLYHAAPTPQSVDAQVQQWRDEAANRLKHGTMGFGSLGDFVKNTVTAPYQIARLGVSSVVTPLAQAVQGVEPKFMRGTQDTNVAPPNLAAGPLGHDTGADFQPGPNVIDVAGAVGKGAVHPFTDLAAIATGRKSGSTTGILSDIGQIALMLSPAKVVEGASVVRNLVRATTGNEITVEEAARAAEVARTAPLAGTARSEIAAAMAQTGASPEQVQASLALFDQGAYALSARLGVEPQTMFDRMWSGAKFSDAHPELMGGEFSDAIHTQMDEMHNIPAEKQTRNIKAKAKGTPENMLPQHDVVSTSGHRVLGRVTAQEWLDRLQAHTPSIEQQKIDAAFYDRLEPTFKKVFGDGYMPVLKAFSASQANAGTKEGLASVLRAAERIERGAPVVGEEGGIGSVVADAIERAYKGEILTKGQAAKLSDFIDSIRQLKTREWMAHNPAGLEPAAGDVWSSRDVGYLDPKLVGQGERGRAAFTHKFIQANHGVNLRDLKPDIPGAPSGSRYEHINAFYNDIAKHLNDIGYHGRHDWSAAQAQAMGWANIQRFYGRSVRDLNEWVDAGIRQAKQGLRRDQGREAARHIAGPGQGVHVIDRKTAMSMEPHPDFLYHGTNDHGLEGIMREGKIRAMPTERNPDDIRAWLTDHPARAGAQGRHTIAIPRKNIPDDLLSHHPLGMSSSPHDIPIFGDAQDSRVAMVHSEAEPYPDLHPAEHEAYAKLSEPEKVAYAQAIDRAVQGASFKSVLGLTDKGSHYGVGVWRGAENPGVASKVAAPLKLTAAFKAKMDALAAAEGMAKEQGSVSWGRPLPDDAYGPDTYGAVLVKNPGSLGALGAAVDKEFGDGMIGVIHGPENSVYLVDFAHPKGPMGHEVPFPTSPPNPEYTDALRHEIGVKGREKVVYEANYDRARIDETLSRLQALVGGHEGAPRISWQGGYVHDERLTEMADPSAQTFQQAIDGVPEAATLKNAVEHTNAVVKNIQDSFFGASGRKAQGTLDTLYRAVFEQAGGTVGPRGMSASDITATENYLHDIAAKHPDDPTVQQFLDLYENAADAKNPPDPEHLFPEEGLFGSLERAQGVTQLLRQEAKAAVVRYPDLRHDLLLTPQSDVSSFAHEFVHAAFPFLGHIGADEERYARSFEAWLMEGVAPTPELQPAFDTLAKAMRAIYGDAMRIPGNALDDNLRAVFENFFQREGYMLPSEDHLAINPRDRYIPIFLKGDEVVVGEPGMDHAMIDPKGGTLATHGYAVVWDGQIERVNFSETNMSEGAAALDKNPEVQARVKAAVEAKYGVHQAEPGVFMQRAHDEPSHWTEDAVKLADEHGVDIADVRGTGEGGRVTQSDVRDHIFAHMTPEEQLKGTFQGLKIARGKQEAGYREARGEVAGRIAGAHETESLSPVERARAAAGEMKGELPKIEIGGQVRQMTQDALEHLVETALTHPTLRPFERQRTAMALIRLIEDGTTPQRGEIALFEKVWGKKTTQGLKDAVGRWGHWKNQALSILNIPRAIESTLDVSFGLRQGLVAAFYDPKNWWSAYRESFSYLNKYTGTGEAGYQKFIDGVYEDPNIDRFKKGGLAITDLEHEAAGREESVQSNLAERMTIKGHGPGNAIRGAGRGYTAAAVGMRVKIANAMLDVMDAKAGRKVTDEQQLKDMMSFVNAITGRGNLPGKVLEESAPLVNALFFSPRLLGSRLQMLSEPFNMKLAFRNPYVYRQYVKANAKLFGTMGLILASVRYFVPGASVDMNPRSSDFGKIRVGDARLDLLGGFNQVFHQIGEQVTGEKISTTTGRKTSLTAQKFGAPTRFDEFVNFLKGKEAPSAGIVTDWASNTNPQHYGQPFSITDEAKGKLQPLAIQDAWSLAHDAPAGLNGGAAAALGYALSGVGIGVQTYGPSEPGKKSLTKYEDWAKQVGITITPAIKKQMENGAALKSITSAHPSDPEGALKEYLAFYVKTTGKHDLDRYASVKGDMARRVMTAVRYRLAGNASRYETAIKYRAKAKGLTK